GTDSDWVVKIIDVWPDEVSERPQLGGYQQMLSADIFRGPYRPHFATHPPPAGGEPHVPAGPSHHGADPVELVPALRSQPAHVRAEHHGREAGELREGDPAHLARARHCVG